jgi:hypothetical protein
MALLGFGSVWALLAVVASIPAKKAQMSTRAC